MSATDLLARARANPEPLSDWAAAFLRSMERRNRPPTARQMGTLRRIAERMSCAEVARLLGRRMADLATALAGEPSHKDRTTWRFRARGSLVVEIAGAKRGEWFDHEAGEGGDALGLVAHLRRKSMSAAYAWALTWLGAAAAAPVTERREPIERQPSPAFDFSLSLWGEATNGRALDPYLKARGSRWEEGLPLRFHPACPRGRGERLPAMLALMTDPVTGEACGIHRTFLAPDLCGKAAPGSNGEPAKMMLGRAGVIRLVADEEVVYGLGLTEGIETGLATMQRGGWRPVWAAASAGGLARFPVLPGIQSLTIFADADGPGLAAARRCCQRWADARLEARLLVPSAGDWDDALPASREAA